MYIVKAIDRVIDGDELNRTIVYKTQTHNIENKKYYDLQNILEHIILKGLTGVVGFYSLYLNVATREQA